MTLGVAALLALLVGVLAGLNSGVGAGVHAAAATALFVAALSVASTLTGADARRGRISSASAETTPGAGHLVHDRLLARYARRRATDVHTRLRPELRRIAWDLLAARHGMALDDPRHAAAIEELVGAAAWDIIRPARPAPPRRRAAGLHRRELERVVSGLERL